MKNKLTIVKVGGGILNENKVFKKFLKNYSQIKGFKLLVHGGGIIASQYMIRLGIPVKMIFVIIHAFSSPESSEWITVPVSKIALKIPLS